MKQVSISTPSHKYSIYIEAGARHRLNELLKQVWNNGVERLFIVTDSTVAPLYLDEVKDIFRQEYKVEAYIIEAGEVSKSLQVYEKVLTAALDVGLDRHSAIVALGGGVVGDLAGFVASTYMRGISFIQMPTTLLAHDSSVGGKTGVNHRAGKNLIGTFHQPDAVIYDTDFLASMPVREWLSGYGEVIKHGYIGDEQLLVALTERSVNKRNAFIAEDELAKSIEVKAAIVSMDERETGVRAYLNFGHTLGHALETVSGYGTLTHGEAVVNGMIFSMFVSKIYNEGNSPDPVREMKWLEKFGYSFNALKEIDSAQAVEKMLKDKKNQSQQIGFVILDEWQKPKLIKVSSEVMKEHIDQCKEELFGDKGN